MLVHSLSFSMFDQLPSTIDISWSYSICETFVICTILKNHTLGLHSNLTRLYLIF